MIKCTEDLSNTWIFLRLGFLRNRLRQMLVHKNVMKTTFVNDFKKVKEAELNRELNCYDIKSSMALV